MTDLLAARSQMAMSLAFHIIFSAVAMAMPLMMIIAEFIYLRKKNPLYLELAKKWAKGTAIMFAVGAVSGTVLSFELGLLWPRFMEFAGPIIGMPFSLEGFAFFLEAIFLGIYFYGWERVPPLAHLLSGVMVLICGVTSAFFILCANGWMNTPVGFTLSRGEVVGIDPFIAMFNPAAFSEGLHMTLAAFMAVSFAVAGIHAFMLLKSPAHPFHRKAFSIAMSIACIVTPITIFSGDINAKHVAKHQPLKLAAMEGLWDTTQSAPLRIGGWPDEKTETTSYAIKIPYLLSFLAYDSPTATVQGIKEFPKEDRPPILPVHLAFQVMIACGIFQLIVAFIVAYFYFRKRDIFTTRWLLKGIVACIPLGFIAIEAGWMVTEIGRQPWVIYGIMRTKDAVTPMPHLIIPFTVFTLLYIFLGIVVVHLLFRQVFKSSQPDPAEVTHV